MYRGAVPVGEITYILPAVLITNTPALALLGKWRVPTALAALAAAILVFMAGPSLLAVCLARFTPGRAGEETAP